MPTYYPGKEETLKMLWRWLTNSGTTRPGTTPPNGR